MIWFKNINLISYYKELMKPLIDLGNQMTGGSNDWFFTLGPELSPDFQIHLITRSCHAIRYPARYNY